VTSPCADRRASGNRPLLLRTKRKADLDNFNKLWQDALSGIVYNDDSRIGELHLYRDYDKARPRIEATIE
jgi:Holliday junction resolvase RusA-like endonuclease